MFRSFKAKILAASAAVVALPGLVLAQAAPTDLPVVTNLTTTNVITMIGNLAEDWLLPGLLIVTVVAMFVYLFKAARRRVKF